MKLASGKITSPSTIKAFINEHVLYRAEGEQYVNMIRLINTSDNTVTFSLTVLYKEIQLRLLKNNYSLAAGDVKVINDKFYLNDLEEIRCSVSLDTALHYIINGGNVADQVNDPTVNVNVDQSSYASGLTVFTSPDSFTGETFFNAYFDYDTADLEFNDCIFRGVCYIKNIGGTITHTNSKGGLIFTNGDPGSGLHGYFGLDSSDF